MAGFLLAVLIAMFLAPVGVLGWWALRPHREGASELSGVETWTIAAGGRHHAFVDLVAWRGSLLMAHVHAPYHMGSSRSRVVIGASRDGKQFQPLSELRLDGRDIRDPKLAVIDGRLHLYVLANDSFLALPHETLLARSEDGVTWSGFERVGEPGWLFWRPESPDGRTWWAPVFRPGEAVLVRSSDGAHWTEVSAIHRGSDASETAILFLPDGRLLATVRLEPEGALWLGSDDAGTLVAWSAPPYTSWRSRISRETRLDGPALFTISEQAFAVGRRQPGPRSGLTKHGGLLSRKRSALYRVGEDLEHLGDLPSAGDTSYAGVVVRERDVLVAYYTSNLRRDYPWILGMGLPTEIRGASLPLSVLLAGREATRARPGAVGGGRSR